jgi:hypothetical protein
VSMISMHELASLAPLLSLKFAAAFPAYIRGPKTPWIPKRRPSRSDGDTISPLSLVKLADQKVADGHFEQARILLEAAYIAFDTSDAE